MERWQKGPGLEGQTRCLVVGSPWVVGKWAGARGCTRVEDKHVCLVPSNESGNEIVQGMSRSNGTCKWHMDAIASEG